MKTVLSLILLITSAISALAQVPPINSDLPAPSPSLATTTPDPFAEMFSALKAATPDRREGLSAIQSRLDRTIDGQIARWKSAGYNVTLAADEKLDNATEDFAEKLRLLTVSNDESWDTAKHNADLALRTAQAAYLEILTKPVRD